MTLLTRLRAAMWSFIERAVPADATPSRARLARVSFVIMLLSASPLPLFVAAAWFFVDEMVGTVLLAMCIGVGASVPLALSDRLFAAKLCCVWSSWPAFNVLSILFGTAYPMHLWLLVPVVHAALMFDNSERRALLLHGFVVVCSFVSLQAYVSVTGGHAPLVDFSHVNGSRMVFFAANLVLFGNMVLSVFFMHHFTRNAEERMEKERARADGLLLNILPATIAERLKTQPEVVADGFDSVSVIFTDIVGFTPLSEKLSPVELVQLLDNLFTRFDDLALHYGLEKIKTIGDAYMVVAGLPEPCADHARRAAHMALAMRDVVAELRISHNLDIRIGMHSGPVIAGVIGKTKFAYDLWGDTVNIASRMESSGATGRVHVSDHAAQQLRGDFHLEYRGEIPVKGKGTMETWWLNGLAS